MTHPKAAKLLEGASFRNDKIERLPGMSSNREWVKTDVHKATSKYSCAHCASAFPNPVAVYEHIAERHGR